MALSADTYREGKVLVTQQAVYYARPEVTQNKVPKTFKFTPVADWWYPAGEWCRQHNTDFCPRHEPDCIRFNNEWWYLFKGVGTYRLKTPIDIKGAMPGSDHKLTFASIEALIDIGWGTWITANDRSLTIYGDTDILFKAEGEKIAQGDKAWITNNFKDIDKPIANYKTLNAELFACVGVMTGAFSTHYRNVMLTVEYVPETPPQPSTVRVYTYNRQTAAAVGGALVQLLSGNRVVAQGYTGRDGWVTLQNVPAGVEGVSYTLLATKSGYEEYKDSVNVVPGENMFKVALVPIPAAPIPWEWIIGGTAVVVIGGVAMAATRKRPEEKVIVVR
jgi:hypothetical protein